MGEEMGLSAPEIKETKLGRFPADRESVHKVFTYKNLVLSSKSGRGKRKKKIQKKCNLLGVKFIQVVSSCEYASFQTAGVDDTSDVSWIRFQLLERPA